MRAIAIDFTLRYIMAYTNKYAHKYGADHILLGTDYPYDMGEADPVGLIARVDGLGDADRAAVGGLNAARLLGIEV